MTDAHKIDLGEVREEWAGQWVACKPHITFAQRSRITALGLQLTNDDPAVVERALLDTAVAWFEIGIAESSLRGLDGSVLRPERAAIVGPNAPDDLISEVVSQLRRHFEMSRSGPFPRNGTSA